MNYTPHNYQDYAANQILDKPACGIFLDLGMGKTVVTLTAIDELLFDRFEVKNVLVVAPLRVAEDTWSKECEKWDHLKHLRMAKVLGPKKTRITALESIADIYIINRENVAWLVNHYGKKWPFEMVVIDELSSFKSPKAKRFKALRKVRPLIYRIVGLTGTPAPNGLLDLWPQIYLLDRGERLGKTLGGYRERYFEPDKRNQEIIFNYKLKPEAEQAIYKRISDICVSMKAQDYLLMPERIDNYVRVEMAPKEKALYKQLERDMLLPFAGGEISQKSR
ncbi:MAG: hypothetical protein APF81_19750 [Desulfosporosinus sp. BRH_c37]|nr:MAG: hypothetical protein APF81_19750 [Desulfosporosinus sp. BRH_c37]